jgi:hypothetical protein
MQKLGGYMKADFLGTIREFKTAQFTVKVEAYYDYDTDTSWDETGETLRNLESGKWVSFYAKAIASHKELGEIATDYLGGCVYKDIADFQDHRQCGAATRELRAKGSDAVCGSYFSDMIKTVCAQARKQLIAAKAIKVRIAA